MFDLRSATSHLNDSLKFMRQAMYVSPVESYHQSIKQIQEAIKPPVVEISKYALNSIPDVAIPNIPTASDFMSPTPSEIAANMLPELTIRNFPSISGKVLRSISIANDFQSSINQMTSAIRLNASLTLPSIRNLAAEVMLDSRLPLEVFERFARKNSSSTNEASESNQRVEALDEFFSSYKREYDTEIPNGLHSELREIVSNKEIQEIAEAIRIKISSAIDEKVVMYLVLLLTAIQTAIEIFKLASGD